MTTLTILSDKEVSEYVAGLNLAATSSASATLSSMLLLPPATFARAVSAVAQGLISFDDVRVLPAINERLVNGLINSRMGETEEAVLAWRYANEWIPAAVDLPALRASAIGDAPAFVASRVSTRWNLLLRPKYDFTKTDEKAFHSYSEAFVAYMAAVNSQPAIDAVAAFRALRAQFLVDHPEFTGGFDPINELVSACQAEPVFLERPNIPSGPEHLDYLLSGGWRSVSVQHFDRFMAEFATACAAGASDDPARTGLAAAATLQATVQWGPLDGGELPWTLSRMRMARVYLPGAYAPVIAPMAGDAETEAAAVAYLEAALAAIMALREIAARELTGDASLYRAVSGSPSGLLLAITNN